ncbi:UNVERIFIED_ORG: pyruvate/2-oxoglutarate dehydrogenase complex dihydrolipoamide dehydrogenase (E3) component [Ensifer adhaerens]|uniref:FAD-dependent oxidoreductase n=1 Tax=Ensifer canadensis TaxID=555315 RepID=UPI00148F94A3|nr:pyruvate/2-oxoglutarate dehydrogenase complex dihydrolipoamide dehydrogenase (E3) component [Ensifer adhaerens]NOV15719.1 dihydrolipoamide dehydrogenase [Ensifer canadensis]
MAKVINPDICVIGGGAAGLSVAAGAAAFGVPVVLIERGTMGGDCLNHGCVPSKTLIAAARHAQAIRMAGRFGLAAGQPVVDYQRLHARIHEVIAGIAPHDSVERFTGLGVEVLQSSARFVDENTVAAGDHLVRARRFVVATGSSPAIPDIPGLDKVSFLTNETLFDLTRLPAHLIIVGAGPVGIEMAQAYRRLGAGVTVIESRRALSDADPELSSIAIAALRHGGVVLHEATTILGAEQDGGRVVLRCENGGGVFQVEGSDLLIAAGRRPNHASLGLAAAGIDHNAKGIEVGPNLRTSNRRVYAIGDVAGGLQFTHVASYHARLVLQQMLFRLPAREDRTIVPKVTYSDPEIAEVGLSETEAREKFGAVDVIRTDLAAGDRARTDGVEAGVIKIVAGRRGRILGVGIAAPGAGELINMWSLAVANGMTLKQVRGYVAPYPTLSEIGKQAVISYYAPLARKAVVRSAIRALRYFG